MLHLVKIFGLIAFYMAFSPALMAAPSKTTLAVEHMNCATCPVIVKTALNKLDGVESVQVSMADKMVRVEFDNEKLSEAELAGSSPLL